MSDQQLAQIDGKLNEIQSMLNSMGPVGNEAKEHIQKIGAIVSSLEKDKLDTFLVNSTFLMTALSGTGESAFLAFKAFKTEPPSVMEGSAQLLQMVGSAAQLLSFAGKLGGAAGVILGEILSFVASLLTGMGPQQKSLGQQLREELKEFGGETTVNRLGGVLYTLELQEADLKMQKANSKTWDQILQVASIEKEAVTIWMGDAVQWLGRHDNHKLKVWPYVFEGYLLAAQQYLENIILAFNVLKKTDEQGERLADKDMEGMRRANSVLQKIIDHYDNFIMEVGPVALNKGKVWHIGRSTEVYSREWAVSDLEWSSLGGSSTRLSVGIDERIWTIGTENRVWTGYGYHTKWKKTSIKAEDIWVVKQDPKFSAGRGSLSDVYTIEDGKFCWRTWNEAIKEDVRKPEATRWNKFLGDPYSWAPPIEKEKFGSLVAIGNGTVYLLLATKLPYNPLYVWYKSSMTAPQPVIGAALEEYKGIAISKEKLYGFFKDQIYFTTHKDVQAFRYDWKKLSGPVSNESFVMANSWSYDQLFHSDDGSLLATIDKKIYLWDGQKWRKNESGDALRLSKLPVRGWEIYVAMKNLVEEVRKLRTP